MHKSSKDKTRVTRQLVWVQRRSFTARKQEWKVWGNLGNLDSPQRSQHLASPARFETFQLLYKEGFEHLRTLKERRVVGVVVAAVVKDFGHVGHKLCELVVMSFLQTGFHRREVCKGQRNMCIAFLHYNILWDKTIWEATLNLFIWIISSAEGYSQIMASTMAGRHMGQLVSFVPTHWLLDYAIIIRCVMGIHWFKERPCHFVRLLK